jgi:hypothetical protein
VVLEQPVDPGPRQDLLEDRFQTGGAAPDVLTHRPELVAGAVLELAGGRDLAVEVANQVPEIGDLPGEAPERRKLRPALAEKRFHRPSRLQQDDEVEDLLRRQDAPFDVGRASAGRGSGIVPNGACRESRCRTSESGRFRGRTDSASLRGRTAKASGADQVAVSAASLSDTRELERLEDLLVSHLDGQATIFFVGDGGLDDAVPSFIILTRAEGRRS